MKTKFLSKQTLFYFFALLGMLAAAYSVRHWFMLEQGVGGESICNINDYWNCDKVTQSVYGNWFGIPIGVFGLLYWAFVVMVSMLSNVKDNLLRYLLLPPCIVNLVLLGLLLTDLNLGCLVCYLNYVSWFGALMVAWNWRGPKQLTRVQAIIAGSIFAVVMLVYVSYEKMQSRPVTGEEALQDISQEERTQFSNYFQGLKKEDVSGESPLRYGPETASVTITEFSDFGCPHCAKAATTVLPEIKKIKDVRIVYFPLPIDPACHPGFAGKGEPNGRCEWAKGVICAHRQGKTWEYHDRAFRILLDQHGLPKFDYSIVSDLNLDSMSFDACMKDPETTTLLKSLIDVSQKLDIQGTPTFFVNGRRFRGMVPLKTMIAAIVEARKDAQK